MAEALTLDPIGQREFDELTPLAKSAVSIAIETCARQQKRADIIAPNEGEAYAYLRGDDKIAAGFNDHRGINVMRGIVEWKESCGSPLSTNNPSD